VKNSERLFSQVGGMQYSIQYLRLVHLEGYTDEQSRLLAASRTYDVSFRLERVNGIPAPSFGITGTGSQFRVLGGVANGIADWAAENKPDYLHWQAMEDNRQRLYDRMVRLFAEQRGSGYARLPADPFTGKKDPTTFWLARSI
jgi:hypothetical protein